MLVKDRDEKSVQLAKVALRLAAVVLTALQTKTQLQDLKETEEMMTEQHNMMKDIVCRR